MPTLPKITLRPSYTSLLADHVRSEAQQVALLCDDENADTRAIVTRIGYLESQVRALKALYMPEYELNHETASEVV